MRQGQQNRRGRGRGRKSQNPLSRNYESNGPEVKIRGNASHIAEKYAALARDALASGDTVTAENFLQHAEHYNRIIMAAQAQTQAASGAEQPSDGANGSSNPRKAAGEADVKADKPSGKKGNGSEGETAPDESAEASAPAADEKQNPGKEGEEEEKPAESASADPAVA